MRRLPLLGLVLLLACGDGTGPASDGWLMLESAQFKLHFQPIDNSRASQLLSFATIGASRVAPELAPLGEQVTIRLFADRTLLDPEWRQMMGAPDFQFECWMIGGASATTVLLLSPRAYSCNPTDVQYVQKVITHELVHVVHRRANTDPSFARMATANWFIEGLAGYISGQYDTAARRQAADAARANPNLRLSNVMSNAAGYALSASIVAYIDNARGRAFLRELMREPSLQDILSKLGLTEDELLSRWRNGLN